MTEERAADFDGTKRFTVLRRLGAGGMGVVYEAHDDERDVVVALKLLPHGSPLGLVRFKREFRALTSLVHPNLVAMYELVADDNQWFFTMELVEGVDFNAWTRPDDALDTDRLRDALRQLAAGIEALHDAGRLHRDLKPSNVMVRPSGRVVILDFGLVTDVGVNTTGSHGGGTAAYMAPEQWQGEEPSPAGDWYAVGVMLFEALAGQLPFSGRKSEILIAKLGDEAPSPSAVAPGLPRDLVTLCEHLLRRDPSERASGADVVRALGSAPHREMAHTALFPVQQAEAGSGLVGREQHLATMAAAFASVEEGGTVTLHVHGESGAGKSTLLDRFVDGLRARGDVVVLSGRCFEQESVPYKALDTLVDALSVYLLTLPPHDAERLIPPHIAALARLFPVLHRIQAIAAADMVVIPDERELRRVAFTALRELLSRLGKQHHLVLMIDDLQWGDVDSALLLGELLQPPGEPRLLALLSYRTEYRERSACLRTLADVERTTGLARRRVELVVGALSLADAERLAVALLDPADPRARGQARQVAVESRGNPYFVAELVRHVREGGGWGSTDSSGRRVDLDEVLWHRVVRLPEDPRTVLEVVAVAGQPLRVQVAGDTLDAHDHLQHSIGVLRNGHLIRSSGPRLSDDLETYHDRVRESVVTHLNPALVRHYHDVLAAALEARPDVDAETIGVHLEGAGHGARAGEFYGRAARAAAVSLAFERAATLYRRALGLHAGSAGERRVLERALADALSNAGRGFEAAEAYLAASAGTGGDELTVLEGRAASEYCISGHPDQGRKIFKRILARIGLPLPDSPLRVIAALVWRRTWLRLRGVGFTEREASAIDPAVLQRIDLLWSVSTGLSLPDALGVASMQTKGLLLALEAGEPYRLARSLAFEAFLVSTAGWPTAKRTAELFAKADALARRIDDPHALGMVQLSAGLIALDQTRFADAMAHCEEAEVILRSRCTGVWWEVATARSVIAWTLWHRGHCDELRRRATAYISEARDRGDMFTVTNLGAVALPHLSLIADDPVTAAREVDEAIAQWGVEGFHLQHVAAMLSRAHIHLYRGDGPAALAHIDSLWPALRRALQLQTQIVRIMMVDLRARCVLAAGAVARDHRSLARRAERYARQLDREQTAMSKPFAATLHAGVAALRRDADSAVGHLRRAMDDYAVFDDRLRSAAVRHLLGQYLAGDAGAEHRAVAASMFARERVRRPEGMVALYAPGHGV